MSEVLLLTGAAEPAADILPSLSLLPHTVRLGPAEAAALTGSQPADVVLIDSRRDLMHAKSLFRLLRGAGLDLPMLAVVAEGRAPDGGAAGRRRDPLWRSCHR